MLHDLIELYYYIKNLDKIDNAIYSWRFETCGILHYLDLKQVMNPHTGEIYLAIKLYVTSQDSNFKSSSIRVDPNRVVYRDSYAQLYTTNHEGALTDENADYLLTCLSTEEVNAIGCIYDEINALYKRSRV